MSWQAIGALLGSEVFNPSSWDVGTSWRREEKKLGKRSKVYLR
jgi:hypothetical protein